MLYQLDTTQEQIGGNSVNIIILFYIIAFFFFKLSWLGVLRSTVVLSSPIKACFADATSPEEEKKQRIMLKSSSLSTSLRLLF